MKIDSTVASGAADDVVDEFALNLVLTQTFEALLKRPESDDDSEEDSSAGVANEINKPIAAAMAQATTGFGQ